MLGGFGWWELRIRLRGEESTEFCAASLLAATATVEQLEPSAIAAAATFSSELPSGGAGGSGTWAVLEPSGSSGSGWFFRLRMGMALDPELPAKKIGAAPKKSGSKIATILVSSPRLWSEYS